MARYGRDFMGRVRGWWERVAGDHDEPRRRGYDDGFMGASGPGAEGYYLSREMAREAEATMDYRRPADGGGRGWMLGGLAQFGRAGRGRGYGGDYRPGRAGYDRADFFVNRHPGDDGYREGSYGRDVGMRREMGRGQGYDAGMGGRGYRADDEGRGFATGYVTRRTRR